jgi:site-specific DNA-methyltransferase (adenine-specific)
MDSLPDKGADVSAFTGTIWHAEALDLLSRLPDKSIDLILTDFPYNTLKHLEWDKNLIDLGLFWDEAWRVIKPNCAIVSTASQPFTSILIMSNQKHFRHEWIWQKSLGTGYLNANRIHISMVLSR